MTRGYQIFIRQLPAVVEAHSTLSVAEEKGEKFLRGTLDVVDAEGKFWESYNVEIRYKAGFPYRFPKLFEIGGKIPKIVDWHIFPADHSCCITIPPNEVLLCRNEITVLRFIKDHCLPYLFNQTHRRKEGFYVNGEYEHDIEGFWQFYEKELRTLDRPKILQILLFIARQKKPGKKSLCFCGSGEKYSKCHREAYIKLSKLGKVYLLEQGKMLFQSMKIEPAEY